MASTASHGGDEESTAHNPGRSSGISRRGLFIGGGAAVAATALGAAGVAALPATAAPPFSPDEPDLLLHPRYDGRTEIACDRKVAKGEELGWFEHGSTIIVFVAPGHELAPRVAEGATIRMGQELLRRCA